MGVEDLCASKRWLCTVYSRKEKRWGAKKAWASKHAQNSGLKTQVSTSAYRQQHLCQRAIVQWQSRTGEWGQIASRHGRVCISPIITSDSSTHAPCVRVAVSHHQFLPNTEVFFFFLCAKTVWYTHPDLGMCSPPAAPAFPLPGEEGGRAHGARSKGRVTSTLPTQKHTRPYRQSNTFIPFCFLVDGALAFSCDRAIRPGPSRCRKCTELIDSGRPYMGYPSLLRNNT